MPNHAMSNERTGDEIVSESYLEVRAKLLEIAATFDRIDRATDHQSLSETGSEKHKLLLAAVEILRREQPDRAESLQQLFSRPYEAGWRSEFGLSDTPRTP